MTADSAIIGPIKGNKAADIVPPSLDQAREFARHSKAENTLRGYRATGGTSAAGVNRMRLVRFPRRLRLSRHTSQNARGG